MPVTRRGTFVLSGLEAAEREKLRKAAVAAKRADAKLKRKAQEFKAAIDVLIDDKQLQEQIKHEFECPTPKPFTEDVASNYIATIKKIVEKEVAISVKTNELAELLAPAMAINASAGAAAYGGGAAGGAASGPCAAFSMTYMLAALDALSEDNDAANEGSNTNMGGGYRRRRTHRRHRRSAKKAHRHHRRSAKGRRHH